MKRTIVIVDDEPITRMDTREILEANGYDVVGEASDGFEAIEVCKKYNPSLVLMDIDMPLLDGIKASKVVKRKSDKLKELALKDPCWNINYIKSVVEDTFYSIQYAWNDDEYERVESLLTTSLYNKHLKVLEELKRENKKNVLKDIQFKGCRIISLFEGDEKQWGFIWVEVNFSMIDYIVNTKGKRSIIEGNDNYSRSDFEYWKFVYIENTWLLSNILQKNEVGSGYKKLYREAENAYGSINMKKS